MGMGVKHSKQSVDISSTPKKPGAPVEEINGKTVEEKVEETKLNGDAETSKDEGKKTSAKDKIKKKLSMRSLNFLRKKPKNKEDADASKNEDADKTVEEEKAEEEQPKEDKPAEEPTTETPKEEVKAEEP